MVSWAVLATLAALARLTDAPDSYAVTGARILVGTGEVIENGVLVVDDGLIVGVGERLEVPEGAWVIDATGKTVYPGFIDALSNVGLGTKPPAEGNEPRKEETLARGPEDRPGTYSYKAAADELSLSDDRVVKWRSAGFTSAVTVPESRAALLNFPGISRNSRLSIASFKSCSPLVARSPSMPIFVSFISRRKV